MATTTQPKDDLDNRAPHPLAGITIHQGPDDTRWLFICCHQHEPESAAIYQAAKASGVIANTSQGPVLTANELNWPIAALTYPTLAAQVDESFGTGVRKTQREMLASLRVSDYSSFASTWERLHRNTRSSIHTRIRSLADSNQLPAQNPFSEGWADGLQFISENPDPTKVAATLSKAMRHRIQSNGVDDYTEGRMAGLLAAARAATITEQSR